MKNVLAAGALLLLSNLAYAGGRGTWREQGPVVILHPVAALTTTDRAELAREGIFVKHPLTGGRYLARWPDTARVSDARIASVEPLTAAQKIHPTALRETTRGATWARLYVIFQADVPFEDARAAVLSAGAALSSPLATDFEPTHRLTVTLAPASLYALAADDRVFTITGPRHFRVAADNAESAALSHVTELYSSPYNLSGAGVTVSLFELAEAQATHPEFGGRLTLHASGGSFGDKQHATHVAGTIGAAGINPAAKGMAPEVAIHQFCVTCGQEDLKWLEYKRDQLGPLGVSADNNSWGFVLGWTTDAGLPVWTNGDLYYGAYDLILAAPLDDISISKNILFVHSAGNDGTPPSFQEFFQHYHVDDDGNTVTTKTYCYSLNASGTDCPATCTCETTRHHDVLPFDTIGVTASAKNVVTVGAVSSALLPPEVVGFSSRGPAKDGRVKPDVVARGYQVYSTIPTNSYGRNSGTSMAAPAVTGIAALLTEQWRKTFLSDPKPAQLKALLIAGAEDLGNPGPDYSYGFGLVNAKASVDTILADGGAGRRIRNLTIAQGATEEIPVLMTDPGKLRVVLQWPDPPIPYLGGDDIAAKALVNDLDLSVVDPAGNTLRPYVLDKAAPNANATTGINHADNTEEVEIASAAPGVYRVRVAGSNVAQGPQSAVLVTSANTVLPCLDPQERSGNNAPETAVGNLVPGSLTSGAICTQGDVDYFKFVATKAGPVTVTLTAYDTPMRATLTGPGINTTLDVAANATGTLATTASTIPNAMLLKIEATTAIGVDPRYAFTLRFGETNQPRRRSVR